MPNIREAPAQNLEIRPSETGIDAFQSAARRVGAFYGQAADDFTSTGQRFAGDVKAVGDIAVKQVEHHEIANGSANFAKLQNDLTQKWNDAAKNADPTDPTVAAQFREKVMEPALQQFGEKGFLTEGGEKFAESHVNALRQHMFEKTSADMSTLAGEAVKVNAAKTINNLSSTVQQDPSSIDFALKTADSSFSGIVGSSPNLNAADAGRVKTELLQHAKEQIVKSAALGYIEKTGEVPKWATDPKYADYINGAELKQLSQAARYYNRLNESDNRAARVQRDYEAKVDFNKKANDLEISTIPNNAGEKPQLPSDYWQKLRELGTHPGAALEPGRLRTMVTNGEALTDRLNKPEPIARISHDTTMGMLTRIRASDASKLTDNGPIYEAYQQGKLNTADFNFLNGEFNNLRTPEGQMLDKDRGNFSKSFARLIDGNMNATGEHSVLGTQRMYEFEMDARRQEADLRKKGLDPHLTYDPRSEYFFGRPENIAKYRVSMQEAQKYEKTLKAMDEENAKGGGNLTGPNKTITGVTIENAPAPKQGDRKEFKQGWGVWNGATYVPEKK